MTREEAIKKLVNARYADEFQGDEDLTTALHMAVDALNDIKLDEWCDDAVSRQAVLDGIEELKQSPWATDKRNGFEYLITEALDIVADLCVKQEPPVRPQEPKSGHWIKIVVNGQHKIRCDKCDYIEPEYVTHIRNYCPNCGARMESEDKE